MRQFILQNEPDKNGKIVLSGKDFKYLHQVLRVKTGDMLNLRMKNGNLRNSTVAKIDEKKHQIVLQICADSFLTENSDFESERNLQNVSKIDFCIFQIIPKSQKFELIVRQATECGVKKIVPVQGEFSEKQGIFALKNDSKNERINKIIREARQQSGSPVKTEIEKIHTFEQAKNFWQEFTLGFEKESLGFVLSEREIPQNNLRKKIDEFSKITKVGIICGCEGGISSSEMEFIQNKMLFYPVHFAVNILRCETAALYGTAAIQNAIFDSLNSQK